MAKVLKLDLKSGLEELKSLSDDDLIELLQTNHETLVNGIILRDGLLDHLFSKRVITNQNTKRIQSKDTDEDQMRELLDILRKKGEPQKKKFFQALFDKDHQHVLQAIFDEQGDRKDNTIQGGTCCNQKLYEAYVKKIKQAYKERFKKVQSVSNDGVPTMFDVTSKLYMDLECTPLEIRCTSVDSRTQILNFAQSQKRKKLHQKDKPYKKSKYSSTTNTDLVGSCINLVTCGSDEFKEPKPGTGSRANDQNGSKELNHQYLTSNENQETSQHRQKLATSNSEYEKPTSTAQITRLFTANENTNRLPILVEAEAGVGKTTLFHRLALDWANGAKDMKQFKLVFLIPLRRVKSKKIEDIICDDLQLLKSVHKIDLKKCLDLWDDDILFLIDGLDEVKLTPDNDLTKLLQGTGKHVFCSSRPMLRDIMDKPGHYNMEHYLLVKLLGFSDDVMMKYINQYFRDIEGDDENMADTVMAECSRHFYCRSLMKIPLYAGLLCFLWKRYQTDFPDTATQLFNRFLIEILNNYLLRYSHPANTCNNNLHMITSTERVQFLKSPMEKTVPPHIRSILKHISKLAYTTLMEHKVIFTVEDADKSDLSLADLTHIGLFTIEEEEGSLVYFRHKLFHEYFAGLYLTEHGKIIYTLFSDSLAEIISRGHILQNAFFFAAGLCEDIYERMLFALNCQTHSMMRCDSCTSAICTPCISCYSDSQSPIPLNDKPKGCRECGAPINPYFNMHRKLNFENDNKCEICVEKVHAMLFADDKAGRSSSLDGDIEDLQVLSFFVQLSFEHHAIENDSDILKNLSRLPVHCSSAHSLAAVMYTLQIEQLDPGSRRNEDTISEEQNEDKTDIIETDGNKTGGKESDKQKTSTEITDVDETFVAETNTKKKVAPISMVLIDGPVINIDQLLCILNECINNEDIKYITLMKAGQTLITEILNMKWKHVTKIGFEECGIVVPIKKVVRSFPSTDVVFYDKNTCEKGKIDVNKEDDGEPLQDVAVILKSYYLDNEEEDQICVDVIGKCLGFSARCPISEDKVVTVCVETSVQGLSADMNKCIPESIIKGICEMNVCPNNGIISAVIHEYGILWKHQHEFDTLCDYERPLVFQENLETLQLTGNVVVSEAMTNILDIVRRVFVNITSRLILHDAGIDFFSQLLKMKWLCIDTICFNACEMIVPVDVIAENMPNVKNIVYDPVNLDTLINGQRFTETPTSGTSREIHLEEKLSLTFEHGYMNCIDRWYYRYAINAKYRSVENECQMCTDTTYRHIHVVLRTRLIPGLYYVSLRGVDSFDVHESFDRNLLCKSENVKSICFQNCAYLCNLRFQSLERFHTNDPNYIALIHEQNPDLKEVVLDTKTDLHETSTANKTLAVLQGAGQQWIKTSIVFACECEFILGEQLVGNIFHNYSKLKPIEISYDKVHAWCCNNVVVLNEQEQFVLLHQVNKERGEEKDKSHMLPKEKIMSWMTGHKRLGLDHIESSDRINITCFALKQSKMSVKFIRDEIWDGLKNNLPRCTQPLYS